MMSPFMARCEQHDPNIARVTLDPEKAAGPTRNMCIMFVASVLPSLFS
jgi:hypothetical protein